MKDQSLKFWRWFWKGTGDRPGYRRVVNLSLLLHLVIGFSVYFLVPYDLRESANVILLPVAGILIGLSFAWGGNAQALLQTEEIEGLGQFHPGGFREYVFNFQLAILVILVTLSSWGLAGLGVYDRLKSIGFVYPVIGMSLYTLASLTLRECWHVVLGAQALLLVRWSIRKGTK